ncbi:hypothetical protein [Vulgatibacter sp.]|uniref:hypothetical protein n=1 Tax=Vulgatibacter sp. TaxID=1971226 RepID=UPI0035614ED3
MPAHQPQNRLNEIAQRRLAALGVPTRLAADGATLEGELAGTVRNPLGGRAIERVRFVVEGHDRLRPVAPAALQGLPSQPFFDLQRPEPILARLEEALRARAAGAQAAFGEMRRLRLTSELDTERIRAVARLEITSVGTVVIEGDERGARATQVLPLLGGRPPASLDVPLDFREHEHRVDLELVLFAPAEKALKAPVAVPPPAATPTPPPATPGPAGPSTGVTLQQLVEKFGPDARVGPGLALVRDLQLGEQQLRFVAKWDAGRGFLGRLSGQQGTLWEEGFELQRLPRVEELAAAKLGVAAPPPAPALAFTLGPAAAAAAFGGGELVAGQMKPVAGEVWVMSILVEADTGSEIRYVPVDIDGKPYGTPRTLPRTDFLATFASAGSVGYRLPAMVLQVSNTHVTWVQLDPKRQQVGQPKNGTLAMFVHHFVPEAAAY